MSVTLVLGDTRLSIPLDLLTANCALFSDPGQLSSPYHVKSSVSLDHLGTFVECLRRSDAPLAPHCVPGLTALATEFGFRALSDRLSGLRTGAVDLEARARIADLEEIVVMYGRQLASLSARLSQRADKASPRPRPLLLPFDEKFPLSGIIAHLTRKYGGNIARAGVIAVIGERLINGDLNNLVELDADSEYCSYIAPNQWVGYDFREMRVTPTHYSLRSGTGNFGGELSAWVIEGSLDGKVWVELQSVTGCRGLNTQGVVRSFPISKRMICRFWRLRQIEVRREHSNIILTGIELFGELTEVTE
jgi:hypothetical protein